MKPEQRAPAGKYGNRRVVDKPWEMVSLNIMGPLPLSTKQNWFLLVITDVFSKFSLLFPMREATAQNFVTHLVNEVILMFGASRILLVDNGSQ